MRRLQQQIILFLLLCAPAQAQDVLQLYETSELQQIGDRYRPNLRGMWDENFLSYLTRDERMRAGTVTLNLPLVGAARYPLEFTSVPGRRQVFLPIASVKFLDDMSVAFAYYQKMHCDLGAVSDYAALLRIRAKDARGSPLDTLGVPRTAVNDPEVDDVAQKLLKSIMFFLAAHEYAHVMYRHGDYNFIERQVAQLQEFEADAFALDVMRRISVAPTSLTFFFLLASRLEASPGDFDTSAEYEAYVRQIATHPLSTERLLKVAQSIQTNARAFARLQGDPASWERRLQAQALEIRTIAQSLDDRRMRRLLAERAQNFDMAAFRIACRGTTNRSP